MTENQSRKHADAAKILFFLCFMLLLICWPDVGVSAAGNGIRICYETLLPSLFPFMLCCTCLSALMTRMFRGRGPVLIGTAVVLGMIGGFPAGASAISRLVQEGALSKKRAELLLTGCVNAGPAFLIGGVGIGCFGNQAVGALLLLSLSFASAVCLILALVFFRSEPASGTAPQSESAFSLGDGVRQSVRAVGVLCGYVVFFSCVGAYADCVLERMRAGAVCSWVVHALLEVTGGCAAASSISGTAGALLACAGVSLCSLSICFQIKGLLAESQLSMRYFWLSRPVHCAISVWMMHALLARFERAVAVMASVVPPQPDWFCLSPFFSFAAFLLCCTSLLGDRRGFGFTKTGF